MKTMDLVVSALFLPVYVLISGLFGDNVMEQVQMKVRRPKQRKTERRSRR